jgi:hypothetical protein
VLTRLPVESSHIAAIGYDADLFLLQVEFDDGSVYEYRRVPLHVWAGLSYAASKGSYFHQYILNRYQTRRVIAARE